MANKRSFSQGFQTPAKSIIEPNQHATGTALGKIALRTLSYIKHALSLIFGRITVGCIILVVSLPIPWLFKILIDHGVMALPVLQADLYPFFMQPILNRLVDREPIEVVGIVCLGLIAIFALFGYATNTELHARLAQGADVATQSENKANDGFSAASGLVGLLDFRLHVLISQRITHFARQEIFDRFVRMPVVNIVKQRAGDAVFRVMHDTPSIGVVCMSILVQPIFYLLGAFLGLWILWLVYGSAAPELVWLGASAFAVTLLSTLPFTRFIRRLSQSSRRSGSDVLNLTEEGIRNREVTQSLGAEEKEKEKFAEASRFSFRRSLILMASLRVIEWLSEHVHLLFQSFGYWFIFSNIIEGKMTLGDAPVILRMYSMLYETAMQLGRIWVDQQDHLAAAERVFTVLNKIDEKPETSTKKRDLSVTHPPLVRYQDITFGYPGNQPILKEINLTITAGETLALVGRNGAGKTTLAYLLPQFLEPQSGRILFNDSELEAFRKESIRRHVTFIFQEHQFIDGSVRENLLLGDPSATDEELAQACRETAAWDFIQDLPGALDHQIFVDGTGLSVGQQQRLSIARANLGKSKMLILDEPTASLDLPTELALKPWIQSDERTTLIISHRLTTIKMADRVAFLEDGRIVGCAPHKELVETNEDYAEFISSLTSSSEDR
mgnify:FL=1